MKEHNDISSGEQDQLYEKKEFCIDKGQAPLRIDKWLQSRIEGATRNKIQKNIDAGFLTVNEEIVKSNYKVKPDDRLILFSQNNPEFSIVEPEPIPLNIVYEDDAVMVLNKPRNMVVHPAIGNYRGTLLNGIAHHFLEQRPNLTEEDLPRYGLVHRIDKNTTGLLVVAKTAQAAAHLAQQFFVHSVHRKYIALVWGNIETETGTIETNVGRDELNRRMFTTYPFRSEKGKHAITHYKVLERMNYVTLIECQLETGRTHQIRVHLKHIGHTLFNDYEYGGDKILAGTVYQKYKQFVENCFQTCPRIALHAKELGFIHPVTEEKLFFEVPIPPDMNNAIEKWRQYVHT